MRQVQIGLWPAMSAVAAAAEWEKLRTRREAGEDPALERRKSRAAAVDARRETAEVERGKAYLVRHLCNDWLVNWVDRNRKPKGAKEVRRMFATMLASIEDRPAAELKRSEAFDLLESYAHIPVQAGYLRGALGSAWDYALDAGRLPEDTPNWWRLIMRGRLKSKGRKQGGELIGTDKRVLSDAEMKILLPWLANFTRLVEDCLQIYLYTLTRGAEIVAMDASEISDEADGLWWTIPKAKTKNARHKLATDMRVPLVAEAEAVVRRRLAVHPKGWLFPSLRDKTKHIEQKVIGVAVWTSMPYSEVRPEWERPRLPVTNWSPHDLRRTGRTKLSALGCPDEIAEAVLGHMPAGVKMIYNRHQYDSERRLWLTRLAKHWAKLQAGRPPRPS